MPNHVFRFYCANINRPGTCYRSFTPSTPSSSIAAGVLATEGAENLAVAVLTSVLLRGKQRGNQQLKRRREIEFRCGGASCCRAGASEFPAFALFIRLSLFHLRPEQRKARFRRGVSSFSSIRYFTASMSPRPINAHGGSIASRKASRCEISRPVTLWHLLQRGTIRAIEKRIAISTEEDLSRSGTARTSRLSPMPMEEKRSGRKHGLFAANASARPAAVRLDCVRIKYKGVQTERIRIDQHLYCAYHQGQPVMT